MHETLRCTGKEGSRILSQGGLQLTFSFERVRGKHIAVYIHMIINLFTVKEVFFLYLMALLPFTKKVKVYSITQANRYIWASV